MSISTKEHNYDDATVFALQHTLLVTVLDLNAWVRGMEYYTDAQYGKGKMKELRDRLIRKVMDAHAASNVLEFVWEPKIEWMWDRTRFGYVAAITDLDDAGKDDWEFSVISSGYSTLKFKKPRRGILLLQTKPQEKVTQ